MRTRATEKIRNILWNASRADNPNRLFLTDDDFWKILNELQVIDAQNSPKDRKEYHKEYYLKNKDKISQKAKERYRQKKSS